MFKKRNLTAKLATIIGSVLFVVFTILILVTAALTKSSIGEAIFGELAAVSKSNANQIQEIFTTAGSVATDMQGYIEKAFRQAVSDPSSMEIFTDPEAAELCKSVLYHKTLTSLNYDVENYLVETARSAAKNNNTIVGVGVMFEPYAFQSDIPDYAFYVSAATADDSVTPFGAYETYSQENYYMLAKEARQTVVTEPYEYNGTQMVSFAAPILFSGKVQGVIVADISLEEFDRVDATSDRYKSMFANILDADGSIIYDSQNTGSIGLTLANFTSDAAKLAKLQQQMDEGTAFQNELVRSDNGKPVTMYFSPLSAGSATWWSLTAINTEDANEAVVQAVVGLVILSAVALALIVGTVFLVLRRMLSPMAGVVRAAEQIAQGDFDVHLTVRSQDEIGRLSGAFQAMTGRLKTIVGDLSHLLEEMSGGNFNIRTNAEESYVGEYRPMLMALRSMNTSLSDTISQIRQAADQVSAGSGQVSSGAQALSQGATEQASAVEELAATISEISGQISSNAQVARSAQRAVDEVGGKVEESNRQMGQMTQAMSEISASSSQIGKIIKTIEDIAFQTNILALNAAVEAARAGAAGKGFAVVADEVRSLAGKSSEASKSTAELIEGSLRAVENGRRIADVTATSLLAVVDGTKEITGQIEHIADASDGQAASIKQIDQGVEQISGVVQTNSATAEESAAASEELSAQATMLRDLVSRFRLKSTGGDQAAAASAPPEDSPTRSAGTY